MLSKAVLWWARRPRFYDETAAALWPCSASHQVATKQITALERYNRLHDQQEGLIETNLPIRFHSLLLDELLSSRDDIVLFASRSMLQRVALNVLLHYLLFCCLAMPWPMVSSSRSFQYLGLVVFILASLYSGYLVFREYNRCFVITNNRVIFGYPYSLFPLSKRGVCESVHFIEVQRIEIDDLPDGSGHVAFNFMSRQTANRILRFELRHVDNMHKVKSVVEGAVETLEIGSDKITYVCPRSDVTGEPMFPPDCHTARLYLRIALVVHLVAHTVFFFVTTIKHEKWSLLWMAPGFAGPVLGLLGTVVKRPKLLQLCIVCNIGYMIFISVVTVIVVYKTDIATPIAVCAAMVMILAANVTSRFGALYHNRLAKLLSSLFMGTDLDPVLENLSMGGKTLSEGDDIESSFSRMV